MVTMFMLYLVIKYCYLATASIGFNYPHCMQGLVAVPTVISDLPGRALTEFFSDAEAYHTCLFLTVLVKGVSCGPSWGCEQILHDKTILTFQFLQAFGYFLGPLYHFSFISCRPPLSLCFSQPTSQISETFSYPLNYNIECRISA